MDLYNANTMPLANDAKTRIAQEKVIKGEELTLMDKLALGGDHIIKEIGNYKLKPDHVYRAINQNTLDTYTNRGFITSKNFDKPDEYIENENNAGIDWFLGGVCLKYGYIIIECPAYKEYFVPARDNGCHQCDDPYVRHMKSSGYNNPVPTSMITNIIDVREINENLAINQKSR